MKNTVTEERVYCDKCGAMLTAYNKCSVCGIDLCHKHAYMIGQTVRYMGNGWCADSRKMTLCPHHMEKFRKDMDGWNWNVYKEG